MDTTFSKSKNEYINKIGVCPYLPYRNSATWKWCRRIRFHSAHW